MIFYFFIFDRSNILSYSFCDFEMFCIKIAHKSNTIIDKKYQIEFN